MNNRDLTNKRIQQITDKIFDKTYKKEFPVEAQRALQLARQNDLVGVLLAQAIERGEFENLEGAGQPLNLEQNPFEPEELRMIHKILKGAGFAPSWIELGKEIDALKLKLDKDVDYFRRYTQIVYSENRSATATRQYETKKKDFYTRSREQLVEISKKILDYNLDCPVQLGRTNIDVDQAMSRITDDIETLVAQAR